METETIKKNGASPKSLMSRGGIMRRKIYLVTLCLGLVFGNAYGKKWWEKLIEGAAQGQTQTNDTAPIGGIAKTAKETLKIGESYKISVSSEKFADYKIVTSKDGNLTISLETFAENTWFAIFNGDGKSFDPTKQEIISGQRGNTWIDPGMKIALNHGDKFVACGWNPTVEKFKGNYSFKLDAGTYYIRIFRGLKGLSTANIALSFKDLDGN